MEQLWIETPFVRFVAGALKQDDFVLIDVGAAEGVAPAWRQFGDKLSGFGFDSDAAEIERLNSIEPATRFRYLPGFVGLPADHPFAEKRRGKPRLLRNPMRRLAVERWAQIQRARDGGQPVPPTLPGSLPRGDDIGEKSDEYSSIINLPEFLQAERVSTIDFIKVDVDGTDFDILQSMAGWYQKFGVLGIGIEVNFCGSDSETGNTFHNIDRFLKGQGFELLDIAVRRYPMADLPGPSTIGQPYPGSSAFGRPFQGDAFYARDICAPWEFAFVDSLTGERLAKSAALFALFGLPDCAAEVLVTFRDQLASVLDVDHGLDLLAAQAQEGNASRLSYRDYIAAFETESYAAGGVYSQGRSNPRSATFGAKVRPLALPTVYDSARRIVHPGATCSGTTRLAIRTAAARWDHAIEFSLDAAGLDRNTRLSVALSVVVHRGCVGLGILTADRQKLPKEVLVSQLNGPSLVELVTMPLSEAGPLLVRNAAADGASKLEMKINAVSVLGERD